MRFFRFAMIVMAFSLTACTTLPDKLQTAEGESLVPYIQPENQYQINQGKQARWGGIIADVKNFKNETLLEVVYFPLNASGRPKVKDKTDGRFRAYIEGFLDPMVYKKGKSITVLGKLANRESGSIGEHEYLYPVIKSDYVHLWKDIQRVDVRIQHQRYWYSPYHWYRPYPYVRTPVVIKTSNSNKGSKGSGKSVK